MTRREVITVGRATLTYALSRDGSPELYDGYHFEMYHAAALMDAQDELSLVVDALAPPWVADGVAPGLYRREIANYGTIWYTLICTCQRLPPPAHSMELYILVGTLEGVDADDPQMVALRETQAKSMVEALRRRGQLYGEQ